MSDPFLKAISDWIRNNCDLVADADGRGPVIWAGQKAPRPNAPYIAVTISGDREIAQDWMRVSDVAEEDAEPGADQLFTVTGPRVETLKLECFATSEDWATVRPERVLRRILASRRLPSVAQAFRAANIGFGPVGAMQTQQLERSTLFEPRASVTIALHTISEVSELGTWIERLEITPTIKQADDAVITLPAIIEPPEEP